MKLHYTKLKNFYEYANMIDGMDNTQRMELIKDMFWEAYGDEIEDNLLEDYIGVERIVKLQKIKSKIDGNK